MKVTGPGGPLTPAPAARTPRSSGGFSVSTSKAGAPAQAASASAAGGVANVSSLMALQGVDDPTERRRRSIRRGSGLLDRLDELKLALLSGGDGASALQGVDDPTERRRRSIRRGSGLLDRLDELKLALLSGGDGASALQGLSRAAAEAREADDNPGLAGVLDQIDLRAAVELAKAQRRAA